MNIPESVLVKKQTKVLRKKYEEDGETYEIMINIRYDDECGNKHNTFSMTADIKRFIPDNRLKAVHAGSAGRWISESGGCLHDDIIKQFPKLEKYVKWHLTSSDCPMHYVANSVYHAQSVPAFQGKYWFSLEDKVIRIVDEAEKVEMEERYGEWAKFEEYHESSAKESDLEAARRSAIWPEAELEDFTEEKLLDRLPALMVEFKNDMVELGFEY